MYEVELPTAREDVDSVWAANPSKRNSTGTQRQRELIGIVHGASYSSLCLVSVPAGLRHMPKPQPHDIFYSRPSVRLAMALHCKYL